MVALTASSAIDRGFRTGIVKQTHIKFCIAKNAPMSDLIGAWGRKICPFGASIAQ